MIKRDQLTNAFDLNVFGESPYAIILSFLLW